jgi:hypothetical protein
MRTPNRFGPRLRIIPLNYLVLEYLWYISYCYCKYELSLTLNKKVDVKYFIIKITHKHNILRF